MKAYKIEVLVIDHENSGSEDILSIISSCKHIHPLVMDIYEADIGEWSDDHPLNKRDTMRDEYFRLFR